jgi:Leucine-rich repeat (LRR) protein
VHFVPSVRPSSERSYLVLSCISSAYNGLSGFLSHEIQYLHRLETLSLDYNPFLEGSLDFGLHHLVRLQVFSANNCRFSGTIPSLIGNVQKLRILSLAENDLFGTLPESFFTLVGLEGLGLDGNKLSAEIDQFVAFPKLQSAYLDGNLISGSLSDGLVAAWANSMVTLDMSNNFINSTIPSGLFAMHKLITLDLHGNSLRGSIPAVTSQKLSLEFLSLHDNDLTGVIPSSIGHLSPTLRHLDLAKNKLTTPLPSEIGRLTELTYLFMGQNDLSRHQFPKFVFSLTNLEELSMKKNELTGTIPTEIRKLSALKLLDLDMNRLIGTIPEELGFLSQLDVLLLNRNSLSGSLPETFNQLYDLSK